MNTILTDDERREIQRNLGWLETDSNILEVQEATEAAVLAKLRGQEPKIISKRRDAYNNIDRFLRNNLDDTDYDTFSRDLETVLAAPLPAVAQVPPGYKLVPESKLKCLTIWASSIQKKLDRPEFFDKSRLPEGFPNGLIYEAAERAIFIENSIREISAAAPEAPAQGDRQPDGCIYRNSVTGEFELCEYRNGDHPPGTHVDIFLAAPEAPAQTENQCMNCVAFGSCHPNNDAGSCGYEDDQSAQAIPAPWREAVKVAREALRAVLEDTGMAEDDWNRAAFGKGHAAIAQLDALEGGK